MTFIETYHRTREQSEAAAALCKPPAVVLYEDGRWVSRSYPNWAESTK